MTTFTLPTSRRITQDWNQDFKTLNGKHYPNGFYASIGWKGHNGIDYGCPLNDPVESVCDGVVEYVGAGNAHPLLSGGGNVVLIRNDAMQMRFEYLHLNQMNVYTGQRVKRGQVIAQSGNTGISSGPHLHVGAIPVKVNVNNGYRGRVDLTQWLYGPSNPDYAGIAAAGVTVQAAQEEEEDMALTKEQAETLAYIGSAKFKADIFAGSTPVEKDARNAFHAEALNTGVPWFGFDGQAPSEGRKFTSQAVDLGFADTREMRTTALVAGLYELVKQLSEKQGVELDLAAIQAASAAGVKDAIESITTTVKVGG